jgi:hypothetical protein
MAKLTYSLPDVGNAAVFTALGGGEQERNEAMKTFIVDRTYVVEGVDISRWHTAVKIKGFEGWWNSTLFQFSN